MYFIFNLCNFGKFMVIEVVKNFIDVYFGDVFGSIV